VLTSAAPTADTWAMPTAATDTNKEALFRELNQHIHELGGFGETASETEAGRAELALRTTGT